MHPTKVVVLKLHSPRKPLSAPQYATDAGLQSEAPRCAWHAPGRLELPQFAHSHDALTNSIQIHSIARLNRIVSGMLTDRATRRCGFLRFVTTIDALRRPVAGGIALMARLDRFQHWSQR